MSGRVELHIEELVLHGFEHHQREDVAAAVEARLAELLAERGVPDALLEDADVDRIDAGTVDARRNSSPAAFGTALARTLDGAFRGE